MMRKLTATGLAALAVAGLAGTGAALASSPHSTKAAAVSVAQERSSRDSANDRSRDAHSSERTSDTHALHESER